MKYLKQFETFSTDDINDISDILQDFIDNNDLVHDDIGNIFDRELNKDGKSIYYFFPKVSSEKFIKMSIISYNIDSSITSRTSKIDSDINSLFKRLELMGFECERVISKVPCNSNISDCSISIRDIKISSKQLPKIESFKKFESFDNIDIEDVHEMIQDFIEDNDIIMDDNPARVANSLCDKKDIFYYIDKKYESKNVINLSIYIPKSLKGGIFKKSDPRFKKIKNDMDGMIKRIKLMGLRVSSGLDNRKCACVLYLSVYPPVQNIKEFKDIQFEEDIDRNIKEVNIDGVKYFYEEKPIHIGDKIIDNKLRYTWIADISDADDIGYVVTGEQIIESRLDNKNLQLWKSNDARPIISEIYTIIDEVYLGPQNSDPIDFLVSVDQFIQYAIQYDGYFAGNVFQNIGELKHMLEFDTDGISPTVYIAPFWFTRTKADLVNFWDVYSDTIYIKLLYDLSDEEIDKIKEKLKADECYMMEGKSGNLYLRVWWD